MLSPWLRSFFIYHQSSPSLDQPHFPLLKSQITCTGLHHPVFRINFLLHSINLILIILLHILLIPLNYSHLLLHHHSHHPSLTLSSTPDSKQTCSTNHSHHKSSATHWTAFTDFVLINGFLF